MRNRFKFQPVISEQEAIQNEHPSWEQHRQWRIEQPCAIQARQSTTKQTIENRESSEAQTKDQLDKVHQLGWMDNKITIFIEGDGKRGVSGRLRIDERPGLSTLLEGVYNDTFKTIFTWSESRLFRDEFMIGPDTFIKACYDHDVQVVTWTYRYDFRRNPYDMDQFRMQCQIAARFIKDHVGMMLHMRDRVARRGQFYAGSVAIGYILDKRKHLENGIPNPNYNRFIPYKPYAQVIRLIFKRYRELGGNIGQLGRELQEMFYLFPPYETGIKGPSTKLQIKNGGYSIGGRAALIYMLTNVTYIGYWRYKNQVLRDEEGKPIINHPPIVEESDFWYAFNRLSPVTVEGEANEQRENVVRYDQLEKVPSVALLKMGGIITGIDAPVYCVKVFNDGKYKENYVIAIPHAKSQFDRRYSTHVDASMLDVAFVAKMFEHITAWKMEEETGNVGSTIYKHLQEEEVKERQGTRVIDEQIEQIQPKIAHFDRLVKGGFGLDDDTLTNYGKELAGLRKLQKELEARRQAIEKGEAEKAESQQLLEDVLERWNQFSLNQKRRVIQLVVDCVIISRASSMWVKVEIIWKGIEFPTADIGYLFLLSAANTYWQPEEDKILREMYPYSDADAILEKLPNRAWHAIIAYATRHKIKRCVRSEKKSVSNPKARILSANDLDFMERYDLKIDKVERGKVYWADGETLLPLSEEDYYHVDEWVVNENNNDADTLQWRNEVAVYKSNTSDKDDGQSEWFLRLAYV